MNKHTRMIILVLALTAVLLLATASASAKETRREFTGEHRLCSVGTPEEFKSTGTPPVEHVRGIPWTGRAWSASEPLYNADSEGFQNSNLNTATGSGGVWGTFVKYVDSGGRWEGTYAGYYVDNVAYIKVVGHGQDDLAGMKYFATFFPKDPAGIVCPDGEAALAASDVVGVILDTRGD